MACSAKPHPKIDPRNGEKNTALPQESAPEQTISCKGLAGAAQHFCDIESGIPDEHVESLWSCMESVYTEANRPIEDLNRLANVGITRDETGLSRLTNDPEHVEDLEKIELAYRYPDVFGRCIVQAKLPLPLMMNDFDDSTNKDQQLRQEIHKSVRTIIQGKQSQTPADRKAQGESIFDWAKETFSFFGDCAIECTDLESAHYEQGRCSEASARLFFPYHVAGLDPRIMYVRNFDPGLEWIDILPQLGQAQEHVLIGIPSEATKGAPLIQADLINGRFDKPFEDAHEISKRTFVSRWLFNRAQDLGSHNRMLESEQALQDALTLDPDNIIIWMSLGRYYHAFGRHADRDYVWGFIQRNLGNHPWTPLLGPMLQGGPNASIEDPELREQANAKISKMAESQPELAAQLAYMGTRLEIPLLLATYRNAVQSKNGIDPKLQQQLHQGFMNVSQNLALILSLNPKNIFAYRDLIQLLQMSGSPTLGADAFGKLTRDHPGHAPFLYAYAQFAALTSKAHGVSPEQRRQIVDEVLSACDILERMEPDHPEPPTLRAKILAAHNRFAEALSAVERADALQKKRGGPQDTTNDEIRLFALIYTGDEETLITTARNIFARAPHAPALVAQQLMDSFYWSYTPGEGSLIRDEIQPVRIDGTHRRLMERIAALIIELDRFPEARESVAQLRAFIAPYALIVLGREKGHAFMAPIPQNPSDQIVAKIAQSTTKLTDETLFAFNAAPDRTTVEDLEWYLDQATTHLAEQHDDLLKKSRQGLCWLWVLHEDIDGAKRALSHLSPQKTATCLASIANTLIRNGGESRRNTERLDFALTLIWERRSTFTREQLTPFVWLFEQLAELSRKHGLSAKANRAVQRSRLLKR